MAIRKITLTFVSLLLVLVTGPVYQSADSPTEISMVFMGDIVIDGILEERVRSQGTDYPFERIDPYIKDADVRFANLEAPISDGGIEEEGKYATFRTEPGGEQVLVDANIDVVSLSNNHCLDYGPHALNDTMEILANANISHSGIWYGDNIVNSTLARPLIIHSNGLKIGFLAYTENVRYHWIAKENYPGPLPLDEELIESDIKFSRQIVDILIVSIHWRKWPQYTPGPEESDRILCRDLIDLGVDVILGHGPHTVHEIEEYKNGLILYSLGNVAMNAGNTSSHRSYIAEVKFSGDRISSLNLIPIYRKTYRYVPMGTPIHRNSGHGLNITYQEVHEMYEVDTYGVVADEREQTDWNILVEDSPWYVKILIMIAAILTLFLFVLISYYAYVQIKRCKSKR